MNDMSGDPEIIDFRHELDEDHVSFYSDSEYYRQNSTSEPNQDQINEEEQYMKNFLCNLEENEPIFDNLLLYPTPNQSEIAKFEQGKLTQGTVEALITYITSPEVLDYQILVDFFLTFRKYIDSLPLLEFLLCRLSWCLKGSHSGVIEKNRICKIVLVRTFVTIRHWLLNHFPDDFLDNLNLRKLFTSIINEISQNENFVGTDTQNLQSKIIKDLKKSYMTVCMNFWDIDQSFKDDLLSFDIPAYENLGSNRLSVAGFEQLNNPACRRSTLIDMFDKKSLNQSVNLNAKSTQMGQKNPLESFLEKRSDLYNAKRKEENDQANTVLFPKGSLHSFKPSTSEKDISAVTNTSGDDANSIDVLYSKLFLTLNKDPIEGVVELADQTIHKENKLNEGFTIKGNVEIFQDCKINQIQSLAKELDNDKCLKNIKQDSKADPYIKHSVKNEKNTRTQYIKDNRNATRSNVASDTSRSNDLPKKKGFFKGLFSHHNKENTYHNTGNYPAHNNNNSNSRSGKYPLKETQPNSISGKSVIKMAKPTSKLLKTQDLIIDLEKSIVVNDTTIDYLEDLIIHEYQEMLQHPSFRIRYSKQIKTSNRKSVLSLAFNLNDRESKFDPTESPTKFNKHKSYVDDDLAQRMNIEGDKEENEHSFQTPPDTIDWSDDNNMDISHNGFEDIGISSDDINNVSNLEDSSLTDLTAETDFQRNHSFFNQCNASRKHSMFKNTAIRASLQHVGNSRSFSRTSLTRREKYNSDSNILNANANNSAFLNIFNSSQISTFNNSRQLGEYFGREYNNRASGLSSNLLSPSSAVSNHIVSRSSAISGKSYMTYDSDFSKLSDRNHLEEDAEEKRIRKVNRISNLRVVEPQDQSDADEHESQEYGTEWFADGSFNEVNNVCYSPDTEDGLNMSVLYELQELPYYNELGSMKSVKSEISILPSPTPSQTVYNGLSTTDIKELAAIPVEALDCDPLNYTLSKLRGERKNPKVIIGLNDQDENNKDSSYSNNDQDEVHKKHAVAIVCQSPTRRYYNEIQTTINDSFHDNDIQLKDSNDEIKLENQVRDLYISNNIMNTRAGNELSYTTRESTDKLEMNLICRQSCGKLNDVGSTLTKISSSKLLKDDGETSNFDIQSLLVTHKSSDINPLVSINQILDEKMHIPFIFKYDSDLLAKQMTLIERDIIMEVDWKELVNLKWVQPLPCKSWLGVLLNLSDKTGLELITSRFNLVNNWIISEILLCKNLPLRVLTITRFIHLAQTCRHYQNYATLFQIMLALNTQVMKELKDTWIRVDIGTMMKFKQLNSLTSPDNDFENYRKEIQKVVPSKGFIPFLSLELNDLTHYSEMPTIVNSKLDIGIDQIDDDIDSLDEFARYSTPSYDLVNFQKFTLTGETVKNALRYIEWSRFYDFETDAVVISKCLYLSSLCEEEMKLCLHEISVDI